jgi:hypothetical protein
MLTAAQLEARAGKLTASRCACLMRGEVDKIMRLWHELTGLEQEEDKSHIWEVRLGEVTEQLQLDWFEERNRVAVTRRGEVVVHPLHDCFAATLDGWIEEPGRPIECKHTGDREPVEVVIERYQPQLHFQMCCTNTNQCALSIIRGRAEPIIEEIELNYDYADELMRRGFQFMEFVKRKMPPVILPAVPPPVSKFIDYNMTGNDNWRRYAQQWLQTQGAAKSAEEASKVLKSLVPDNARKCFGDGVRVTRDRAGRLSLRTDE